MNYLLIIGLFLCFISGFFTAIDNTTLREKIRIMIGVAIAQIGVAIVIYSHFVTIILK